MSSDTIIILEWRESPCCNQHQISLPFNAKIYCAQLGRSRGLVLFYIFFLFFTHTHTQLRRAEGNTSCGLWQNNPARNAAVITRTSCDGLQIGGTCRFQARTRTHTRTLCWLMWCLTTENSGCQPSKWDVSPSNNSRTHNPVVETMRLRRAYCCCAQQI